MHPVLVLRPFVLHLFYFTAPCQFLLLLLEHYSPLWTLASIPDGLWPLPAYFLFSLYLNFLRPRPSMFVRGLHLFRFTFIVGVAICFGIHWFCILSAWPYHQSRRDFINFTVSAPCNMSFICLVVLILQRSPFMSQYIIFLTIFRSNILSAFFLPWLLSRLVTHVSRGRIKALAFLHHLIWFHFRFSALWLAAIYYPNLLFLLGISFTPLYVQFSGTQIGRKDWFFD